MQITNIKECGSNNILRWAIANDADIKADIPLQSIINDEMCYLITLSDVNFFELFRLTQLYREKIRVMEEHPAKLPLRKTMLQMFPGEQIPDPENEPDKKVPFYELVEYACQNFMNLAKQMSADDDIIRPESVRLFIPMLVRTFNVQIPISFMDFVNSMMTPEEVSDLFNGEYPKNLVDYVVNAEESNLRNMLYLGLLKSTSIIKYDRHYDQLLKMTKYSFLNKATGNRLYKFRLSGFFKYDNITRGEVRCSMFQPDRTAMTTAMKHMASISTPLKTEFVVQLPIQYMQMIESSFSREELGVTYDASMATIIDGGLSFDDFVTQEFDENSEDPEEQAKITEYQNSISAYQSRISEANQIALNTIPILLNSDNDIDVTASFAILPPIYSTKAVFTLRMDMADKYIDHYDPMISAMFQEMIAQANSVNQDIQKSK